MPNYQYTGCVTGVTEADTIQLIQPTELPMPVIRPSNAYTERLVGVGLLLSDDEGAGGGQLNTVNFLKLQNDQQIDGNDGDIAGLVYSIDDGEITSITESLGIEQAFSMYAFLPSLLVGDAALAYGRDGGFGWSDADMPTGLNVDNFYWFGLNALISQAFFAIKGVPVPDGAIPTEVVITVYPASRLPSGAPSPIPNIDYDIFDLIIDPANYTAGDLQYFASKGITPAVKNLDGSYTLKSQLTLPPPPLAV